ncbi:MAG: hypothetical protein JSS02_11825 [Planctomycetes bacterium]|nr:hypothetical protein [Planctomycetota bacterium]
MPAISIVIGFLAPILIGTWIGRSASRPIRGFFLGWVATPIMAAIAALLLIATIQEPFATIVAVESPIVGLATGLISGGFSALLVRRRLVISENRPPVPLENENPATDPQKQ